MMEGVTNDNPRYIVSSQTLEKLRRYFYEDMLSRSDVAREGVFPEQWIDWCWEFGNQVRCRRDGQCQCLRKGFFFGAFWLNAWDDEGEFSAEFLNRFAPGSILP
jgi:hypothetical protein